MRTILFCLMALGAGRAYGALYLTIHPSWTDANIRRVNGDHMVLPPQREANGLLLITLGGTHSTPDEFLDFQQTAAAQGYHVLGLDYPNRVITTVCRQSPDAQCFDHFRSEIVSGAPVSPVTEVDTANCILNRVRKLLAFLQRRNWPGRWVGFLDENGNLDWSRVVLVGHSQGSGHAAFLAQLYSVAGVILIAGPQDVSSLGPAAWLARAGNTPGENYYALLHARDPFGVEWQVEAARRLSGGGEVVAVHDHIPAGVAGRIFVSSASVPNPHMALLTRTFEKAWVMLLKHPYLKKERIWRRH